MTDLALSTHRVHSEPLVTRFVGLFHKWQERSRERAVLAHFGERELHDLGLNRFDVEVEVNKPFWRG